MSDKPRKVKVKMTRTVTEIALVLLDSEGFVEEIDEILNEVDYDNCEVLEIREVLSYF